MAIFRASLPIPEIPSTAKFLEMSKQTTIQEQLTELLQDAEYVQLSLDTKEGPNEMAYLIRSDKLRELANHLPQLPGLKHIQLSASFLESQASIMLENGKALVIRFVHKMMFKTLRLLQEEEVLRSRVKNERGVYIPSVENHFSYLLLSRLLNRSGLSKREFDYFSDFHVLVQEDLLEYFNARYGTTYSSFYQLTDYSEDQRQSVIRYLKRSPANRFFDKVNIRWHSFLGYVRQARII